MKKERVLLVDDDENVLESLSRGLRDNFDVTVAKDGPLALQLLQQSAPFAVIVADMRMPKMNGIELLKRTQKTAPDSVRIMLTGASDQDTAVQALHQGNVFRFLNKPYSIKHLQVTLMLAVRQYYLGLSEKKLLEETFRGVVDVLSELLFLADPNAFETANRINGYLRMLMPHLGLTNTWELEVAAMLSPIGLLTLPSEIRDKVSTSGTLTADDRASLSSVPAIGGRLLNRIPRLNRVSKIVACGLSPDLTGDSEATLEDDEELVLGLRILRVLYDLVSLERMGQPVALGLQSLERQPDRHLPSVVRRVFDAVKLAFPERFSMGATVLHVGVNQILLHDVLTSDIHALNGRTLFREGTRISPPILERILSYHRFAGVVEPLHVIRRRTALTSASLES